MPKLLDWQDISSEFSDSLLIGNGASIACEPAFDYSSIYREAKRRDFLTNTASKLFEKFDTYDFEYILYMLRSSLTVNETLKLDTIRAQRVYSRVRQALSGTLLGIHPQAHKVQETFGEIADFTGHFTKVFSLSYDLLLYWAVNHRNSLLGFHRFKDLFYSNAFEPSHTYALVPAGPDKQLTRVFYPHGSLFLAAVNGREYKIKADNQPLLEEIFDEWDSGLILPIIVTEGDTRQKQAAIGRSEYLRHVLDTELESPGESLTIYGWQILQQDEHILDAVCQSELKRVAVSVHEPTLNVSMQLHQVTIREKFNKRLPGVDVVFFDALSEGAWIRQSSNVRSHT